MEVWHDNDNDNEKKPAGWIVIFLGLLAVVAFGLVIAGATAALSPLIPG